MLDILLDALVDSVKLLPFLFVAFLLIEVFEHKLGDKTIHTITKSKRLGPFIGALFGGIPQCGFSVVATNLYVTRIITLGTLISIYLSTSDEMLPILISHNVGGITILKVLSIKIIVGMIFGFIIDLLIRKKEDLHFSLCESDHCECEESIFKSSLIHTVKIFVFIFIITLIINIIMSKGEIFITNYILKDNIIFAPFIASLVGLIPNCAASVILTELYLNDIISLGTAMAGLLTNSGLAIIVLFRTNKNIVENVRILLLLYFIGACIGLLLNCLNI